MSPDDFAAMEKLDTSILLTISAERDNPRKRAALHILELRRISFSQQAANNSAQNSPPQKIIPRIGIGVLTGVIVQALKRFLGL
jgi:hypothetical protein